MADQYTFDDHEDVVRLRAAWTSALETLSDQVSATVEARFLKPLSPVSLRDGVAVFEAPGAFIVEWVRERFQTRLTEALSDALGEQVKIEVRGKARERNTADEVPFAMPAPRAIDAPERFTPSAKYLFENFVVGQSNRLAHAGAVAVSNEPGTKFNPLFIYGGSGLGKTHLLHAIAHGLQAKDRDFPIGYITAQSFAEQFVSALQTGKIDQFRRAQRNVMVWLVDDIQFIAGRDKTQEEIFHTFNTLQHMGKQIVLCADRPPRELYAFDERLRSRFEAGLVADIQAPDTETKGAILLSKAQQEKIELNHEVAMFLATHVTGNVRTLEGALNRIAAVSSVEGVPITLNLAEQIIEKYYQQAATAKPAFREIVDAVSGYYSIASEIILGTSRKAPIAHARHVAVYITRELTSDSWKHIGELFGDRDHTSMMHAHQKISELVSRDRDLAMAVSKLMKDLYPQN